MLIKHGKFLSLTTSDTLISLLSTIMKLFERVIEKRLRKHLEDTGFLSIGQVLGRPNQQMTIFPPVTDCYGKFQQVIASFLDVEKAFDNVWHNGLRYKTFQLR